MANYLISGSFALVSAFVGMFLPMVSTVGSIQRPTIGTVHCRIYRRCKIPTRGNVRIDHLADRSYPNGHIFSQTPAFGLSRPEIRYRSLLYLPLVLDRAWRLGC